MWAAGQLVVAMGLCRSEDAQGNPIGILMAALCAGHNSKTGHELVIEAERPRGATCWLISGACISTG